MRKIATIFTIVLISFSILYYMVNGLSSKEVNSVGVEKPVETYDLRDKTVNIAPLSIEQILNFSLDVPNNANPNDLITLIATGDYGVVREVNYKTVTYNDFNWAVEDFAPLLKSSDITLINLEGPIIYNCPIQHSGFTFCGDYRHVQGLNYAGIDVVNVANNHAGNYGIDGVNQTKEILNDNNILISGVENKNIVYKRVKNINFAFLGYNDIGSQVGISGADILQIKRDIIEAKKNADVVVVSFHWGVEYTTEITNRQVELAHNAVDNGADLIIGNHSHWIQPMEIYKNKLIMFAHGNFIFDQMWSEETKEGIIGEYVFYKNNLVDAVFYPVYIKDYGKATIPSKEEGDYILNRFKDMTNIYNKKSI